MIFRKLGKVRCPIIAIIFTIILITISFFLPWYSNTLESISDGKEVYQDNVYLYKYEQINIVNDEMIYHQSLSFNELEDKYLPRLSNFYTNLIYILVICLIFSILIGVINFLPIKNVKKFKITRKICIILALINILLLFATAGYFAYEYSNDSENIVVSPYRLEYQGPWGSLEHLNDQGEIILKENTGPSYSWYIIIIAGIICVIYLIFIYKMNETFFEKSKK
jgi:amino acid transporter